MSCAGRRRYVSEHLARVAAMARRVLGKPAMPVYQCRLCKGWHIRAEK